MKSKRWKSEAKEWIIEVLEMLAILAVILIVSRLLLGAQMLVPLVAVTSQSMLHTSNHWEVWLHNHGIPEKRVDTFPMQNGFAMGDMIITVTPNGDGTILRYFPDTQLGDVVIYNRDKVHPGNEPIIHRVVGIVKVQNWNVTNTEGTLDCLTKEDFNERFIPYLQNCIQGDQDRCPYAQYPEDGTFELYITKGDNNPMSDQCGFNGGIALPVNEEQLTARGWIRLPYIGWLKLLLNYVLGL